MVVSKLLSCFRLLLTPLYKLHFKKFWKFDRAPNEPYMLIFCIKDSNPESFTEKSIPAKLLNYYYFLFVHVWSDVIECKSLTKGRKKREKKTILLFLNIVA